MLLSGLTVSWFSIQQMSFFFQVVELDMQYRQRVHAQQLHTYFYGQVIAPPRGLSASVIGDADFDGHLAPSSSVVPFGELSFLRIGESNT
jgi:polyribonucleotide 5'-hydroxyl-kinase